MNHSHAVLSHSILLAKAVEDYLRPLPINVFLGSTVDSNVFQNKNDATLWRAYSVKLISQCHCMAIMCKNESMEGVCVEIVAGEVKCKYLTAEMSKNFVPEHKVSRRHTIITLLVKNI